MDQDIKKALEQRRLHLESNVEEMSKGGKSLPIGTIRKRPNGNFIKTANGWKYHSSASTPIGGSAPKKSQPKKSAPKQEEPKQEPKKESTYSFNESGRVDLVIRDQKHEMTNKGGASDKQLSGFEEIVRNGLYGNKRVTEESGKVKEFVPGETYSIQQFTDSLRRGRSEAPRKKFLKDSYMEKEQLNALVDLIGEDYNVFNYFNKNYDPRDVEVKEIAQIDEVVESNNIYDKMGGSSYGLKEISFKVPVQWSAEPITVKGTVAYNKTLSTRDISSFM